MGRNGCLGKISVQDLYERSLGKTIEEIAGQALYKSSVGNISASSIAQGRGGSFKIGNL